MTKHDATELAYANGYKAGYVAGRRSLIGRNMFAEVGVHCKDCTKQDTISCPEGKVWCHMLRRYMDNNAFCSYGARKCDDK